MSNTTWTALVCAALACGCATGTNTNGGSNVDAAVQPHHDAPHVNSDAPPKMDASVSHDAPAPDAAVDAASSLFCTDNSQCTMAGQCCVTLGGPQGFCANGTVVIGVCVPQ
jgi:hypothetical protein